ncbi:enoyl-CoA hydratase [Rhizophagus irregularis]|uniref:Enoyl-CoA hydratase n=3 Tax=Rhizophagus irregularis TaxID=588596 RepID=A0A2I1DUS8_9GLOM|nr:enoyl-CoA hydratase [Rhizophagus irregularis DAOM 181602=DAOM 197198]EXX68332.1 Ehd3p [Rhizophagus irregularis DAOM 197198w]PKC02318.1 enoyl-CoA hydratase [Rhizophagus irregularis]PKC62199.1 altname: enoyl-CoA hydratase [Rhizophagus irregularis]PKK67235.1 enoyl-CoA hydratase [Rhizophagus irregularis]PKY13626.1 enoyl-CoA hydratase [Rhizophagus irregularis]|eukprot:XP_025182656.1 enoyl-CoA hydratase [Rhizophagus irregularis DAOM 181602=DAOM 197198]
MKPNLTCILQQPFIFNNVIQKQRVIQKTILSRALNTSTVLSSEKLCFVEKLGGEDKGISIININNPATKNAFSRNLLREFRDTVNNLRFENDSRVVLLRSLVDRTFCSGADLKERINMSELEIKEFLHNLQGAFRDLERLPVPTIAVIDGICVGGGLELALCCDMRVAGEHSKIGLPETKLGIIPGAGGTQRLSRAIGVAKAKELIFTGRIVSAKGALEDGIVNYATVEGSSMAIAMNIAKQILPCGPIAIRMAKLAIDRGSQLDLDSALEFEQTCYAQVIHTEDRIEGLKAYKEKRQPVYKGK